MGDTVTGAPVRIPAIDGLRGLAALYVVFHHVWQFSITDARHPVPSWFKPLNVFEYGSYAVSVFLVVSGLCLMLPVVARGGQIAGGLGEFTRRRSRRLLPPYFAVLAATMLVIASVPSLREPGATPWDITLPSFSVGNVVSHLLMVHNWSLDWRYAFNPPLWSIALEFQIYFVFAVALLPIWRRCGPAGAMAAAIAMTAGAALAGGAFAYPWLVIMFTLGMFAAEVVSGASERGAALPWRRLAPLAVVAVPAVTVVTAASDSAQWASFARDLAVGAATMAGLIATTRDPGRPHAVGRLLARRRVRDLGLISFSLYLVHYPVIAVVTIVFVRRFDLGVPGTFAVLTLICVPASLIVAAGFFRFVELRFWNSAPAPAQTAAAMCHTGAAERTRRGWHHGGNRSGLRQSGERVERPVGPVADPTDP